MGGRVPDELYAAHNKQAYKKCGNYKRKQAHLPHSQGYCKNNTDGQDTWQGCQMTTQLEFCWNGMTKNTGRQSNKWESKRIRKIARNGDTRVCQKPKCQGQSRNGQHTTSIGKKRQKTGKNG